MRPLHGPVRQARDGLLAFAIVSCASSSGAPAHRTNEEAEVRQLYQELPRAIAASDLSRFASLLDDSITVLVPGAPPIHGAQAYRDGVTPLFAAASVRWSVSPPTLLQVADRLAVVSYSGELITTAKTDGTSTTARYRYVDILRRQSDGTWRLFVHSFQNDAPLDR